MKRVVCWFVDHDWAEPMPTTMHRRYRSVCNRCGDMLEGNWQFFEDRGLWKHYRSGQAGFWATLKVIIREWWRR